MVGCRIDAARVAEPIGLGVGGALPVFTTLSLIASGVIIYFLYKERYGNLGSRLGLALVLGGAIGNLIDRVLFGRVTDFFDFGLGSYRFFIFNFADAFVTIGVGLYLLMTLIHATPANDGELEEA